MTCPNCESAKVMTVPETDTHWCGQCDNEWDV